MFRGISRLHLPTVDSTNAHAKRVLKSLDPEQLHVFTAAEQTSGRGRLARTWTSSVDDIKMTFAFKLPDGKVLSAYLLSPLLSVTTCQAVATTAGVPLGIKWPNDLIAGGVRKVAGILCELDMPGPSEYWAVLGIGINVNSTPEHLGVDRPVWPLSTLKAEAAGKELDVAAVTDGVISEFASALDTFFAKGFAAFAPAYRERSVLLGKRVRFQQADAPVAGQVVDHATDGSLLVLLDGQEAPTSFISGEVTGLKLDTGEMVEGVPT